MDRAVPNEKWTKESIDLFNKLNEMNGEWKKIPRVITVDADSSKCFQNAVDEPGKYLEFAFFFHAKLQCVKAVVQFGPYTRGPIGHVHGGALGTVLDLVMASCSNLCGYSLTANLNIDYIRPIPLNTTTLVEANINKVDGRKIFVLGAIKTADGCEIFAKATAIFISSAKLVNSSL